MEGWKKPDSKACKEFFARYDTDHNGTLDRAEWKRLIADLSGPDSPLHGCVDLTTSAHNEVELDAFVNDLFEQVDENHDGEISVQELHAWVTWQEEQARELVKEQEREHKRQEKAQQKDLDKAKSKMAAEKRSESFQHFKSSAGHAAVTTGKVAWKATVFTGKVALVALLIVAVVV